MGEGDFKYLAACGAFLGWKALALLVVVAGVTGLVAGVATLVRTARTGGSTAFPFGPHLAFAAVVLLLARPYAPLLGLAHLF
jgi:leader peptidase (prepilin peptidase)/N-methyltransferase